MASMTRRHAATALVLVAFVACAAADAKPRLPARVRPVGAQSRVQPLSAQLRTPLVADAATASADALEQGRKHAPPSADAKLPFNWPRLIISYLLWSLLPLSGAHHLYLGRNRAALLSSPKAPSQPSVLPSSRLLRAVAVLRGSAVTEETRRQAALAQIEDVAAELRRRRV